MSYVKPAILHRSEVWCLEVNEMEIFVKDRDSWWEQCVEYISKVEKDWRTWYWSCVWIKNSSVDYGEQCSLVWSCVDEGGWSCFEKGISIWGWRSKEERDADKDTKEAGWGRKRHCWFNAFFLILLFWHVCFANQSGLLALTGLPLGWGESDHPHLLRILPDLKFCLMILIHCRIS